MRGCKGNCHENVRQILNKCRTHTKRTKLATCFYESKICILLQKNRKRHTNVKVFSFILFAMLSLQTAIYAQPKKVHILSVNDIHATIERFPQLTSIADSLRKLYPEMLVLSAGDNRTGNPASDMHAEPSRPLVELMNRVGFNYSAIGNHEFDGGIDNFRNVVISSYNRYLCANINVPDSMRLHIDPFAVTERGGVRIGILGLTQTNEETGRPDAAPKLFRNISFSRATDEAMKYAWMDSVCDVFILLTHLGVDEDRKLAERLPCIDLIVGGHSHTKLDPCLMENGVMITQTERFLKYAAFTTLLVDSGRVVGRKAELIDVAGHPAKDEAVQALVDSFRNDPALSRVLTYADGGFGTREELGCLMADALRSEFNADIAVQNCGGVRLENKQEGDFTVNDVYMLDPFGNEVVEMSLTGEEFVNLLAAICRADGYGPAYVSGINYRIHLGKGHQDVKDITITMPDGKRIDKKHVYRVMTSSYVASVADFERKNEDRNMFIQTAEVLIDYLKRFNTVNYRNRKCVTVVQDNK